MSESDDDVIGEGWIDSKPRSECAIRAPSLLLPSLATPRGTPLEGSLQVARLEEFGWGSGQTIRVHTISPLLTTLRVFDYYDVRVV